MRATSTRLRGRRIKKWGKPMHGFVKVNVDASFHEDELSGATEQH
jgi:hypothetical protein